MFKTHAATRFEYAPFRIHIVVGACMYKVCACTSGQQFFASLCFACCGLMMCLPTRCMQSGKSSPIHSNSEQNKVHGVSHIHWNQLVGWIGPDLSLHVAPSYSHIMRVGTYIVSQVHVHSARAVPPHHVHHPGVGRAVASLVFTNRCSRFHPLVFLRSAFSRFVSIGVKYMLQVPLILFMP